MRKNWYVLLDFRSSGSSYGLGMKCVNRPFLATCFKSAKSYRVLRTNFNLRVFVMWWTIYMARTLMFLTMLRWVADETYANCFYNDLQYTQRVLLSISFMFPFYWQYLFTNQETLSANSFHGNYVISQKMEHSSKPPHQIKTKCLWLCGVGLQ